MAYQSRRLEAAIERLLDRLWKPAVAVAVDRLFGCASEGEGAQG